MALLFQNQALIRKLIKKARAHLKSQPLEMHAGRRYRILQLSDFFLVESHPVSGRSWLQIHDSSGTKLLRVSYIPWTVHSCFSEDLGWMNRFFSSENGAFIESYSSGRQAKMPFQAEKLAILR